VPALVTVGVLIAVAAYGLAKDRSPSTLNNIAFAALHVSVLTAGAWPALVGAGRQRPAQSPPRGRPAPSHN
jgi:cellulose synthase (UDP-forming)